MPFTTTVGASNSYNKSKSITLADSELEIHNWKPATEEDNLYTIQSNSKVNQIRVKYTTSSVYGMYMGDGIITINGVEFELNTSCLLIIDLYKNGYTSVEIPEIPVQLYTINSDTKINDALNHNINNITINVEGSLANQDEFEVTLIK